MSASVIFRGWSGGGVGGVAARTIYTPERTSTTRDPPGHPHPPNTTPWQAEDEPPKPRESLEAPPAPKPRPKREPAKPPKPPEPEPDSESEPEPAPAGDIRSSIVGFFGKVTFFVFRSTETRPMLPRRKIASSSKCCKYYRENPVAFQ